MTWCDMIYDLHNLDILYMKFNHSSNNVAYDIFAAVKMEAVSTSETLVSTYSVTTPKTKPQTFNQYVSFPNTTVCS
jgi:hypothetical protein